MSEIETRITDVHKDSGCYFRNVCEKIRAMVKNDPKAKLRVIAETTHLLGADA